MQRSELNRPEAAEKSGGIAMAAVITLVPLGVVEPDLLSWLQEALAKNVGHTVKIGQGLPLPPEGYDAGREQYDGGAILAALRSYDAPGAERVVGLVAADCFAPRLNFSLLGRRSPGGRECFVALPRLNPTYYGQPENPDLYRQRVLKEVTHEPRSYLGPEALLESALCYVLFQHAA